MRRLGTCVALAALLGGCSDREGGIQQRARFEVTVVAIDGTAPPTDPANARPPNLGVVDEAWDFTIRALDGDGNLDASFNGYVRMNIVPGSLSGVTGEGAKGRNILVVDGEATGVAHATAMFGGTRLWAEDLGYEPAPAGVTANCANGTDDDGDVLVDFPNDPGCAFADDMTEESGTLATGVSPTVFYQRPSVADVQGRGSSTPYQSVAVDILTDDPATVIVTRVASDGFYVTDVTDPVGTHNHMFAFNFNTPEGMRVCDRLTYLSGTAVEFFGYTEITFPSYEVLPTFEGDPCLVPEPTVLEGPVIADDAAMEGLESALVRVEDFAISENMGPNPVVNNVFGPDSTNCDLNGDGVVDFFNDAEGSCANACSADPQCTEWTGFASRGNYKVQRNNVQIQINTASALGFNPVAHRGEVLPAVSGTLRNFSGGTLNWTIETRCEDDLVCSFAGCVPAPVASTEACVTLRTEFDNDSGTN